MNYDPGARLGEMRVRQPCQPTEYLYNVHAWTIPVTAYLVTRPAGLGQSHSTDSESTKAGEQ